MMEVLREFEFAKGAAKYPWREWLDGKIRKATRGVDFTVTTATFYQALRGYARRHKLDVCARVEGDSVIFQLLTPRPKP